jgi:hypothetical protein
MLYNTGFQHVPKTKTCSQHQFSTMSSNSPTDSRWGLVAYKPWNNVRWLHNTATRGRLDSQRRRCWPWVVRHMPQTRRYLGYGRTFLKHGGVVSEFWTQYCRHVLLNMCSPCGTWIWLPTFPQTPQTPPERMFASFSGHVTISSLCGEL